MTQPRPRPGVVTGVDALAQADAFRDLPRQALAYLAEGAARCSYAAGSVLMRQGDLSDCLHVIARGRVRVERSVPELGAEPVQLAELGPGDVVGEMGVLDDAPRSATVIAVDETETFSLSGNLIGAIMVQYPRVSGALLQLVSQRLHNTKDVTELLAQKNRNWLGPW